jgi:hypothetical protein
MELPLNLMQGSGARIIIALVRTNDMADVLAVVRELGLLASGYAWIGLTVTLISAMLAADSGLPGYLYSSASQTMAHVSWVRPYCLVWLAMASCGC